MSKNSDLKLDLRLTKPFKSKKADQDSESDTNMDKLSKNGEYDNDDNDQYYSYANQHNLVRKSSIESFEHKNKSYADDFYEESKKQNDVNRSTLNKSKNNDFSPIKVQLRPERSTTIVRVKHK